MPHRLPRPIVRPPRRGFTLIEIIVVVALIAILSSLVLLAVGKLSLNAKRQQTTLILHNLQSMWADYDAVVHPKFPQLSTACPGSVVSDNSLVGGQLTGDCDDRYRGSVQLTRSLYSVMRTVPTVRASFDKIPSQERMTNTFVASYAENPWTAGKNYDFTSQSETARYCTVASTSGYAVYLNTQANVADVTNRPPNFQYWFPYTSDPTAPVVCDAWGNPILACFGGSLGTDVVPRVMVKDRKVNPAGGSLDNLLFVNGQSTAITSPDGRLFFASAGPDGDFGLGDDNLYSFDH